MTLGTQARRATRPPWDRGDRPALTGAWWARGLSLAERLAAPGAPRPAPPGDDLAVRAELAAAAWRDAYPALAQDTAALQAEAHGVQPGLLRDLLAEPPEELARRCPKPRWACEVERIVATVPPPAADPWAGPGDHRPEGTEPGGSAAAEPDPPPEEWPRGFARILAPFVIDAARRFRAAAARFDAVADVARLAQELESGLARLLVGRATRILVLELNLARVAGRLSGDTPEQRFWSYVRLYRDRGELAALLDEYVVLARAAATAADQAVATYLEFLERLAEDRARIVRQVLAGADPGRLASIRFGEGDTHEHGRSVGVAVFASGARVVYKPRPMSAHRHFNDLLEWFNGRIPAGLRLRALAVLDRGTHGWVEYVRPRPCRDAAEAERFFRRQGLLLALNHALAAVDLHFENLIAVGDQPVMVDLETILHAEPPTVTGSALLDDDPAAAAHQDSVARVGLLPTVLVGRDGRTFDAGGMGGDRDSETPWKVVGWLDAGTDRMRIARRAATFPGTDNRPRLDGTELEPRDHTAALLAGFRTGYEVLAAARGELLGDAGLLRHFQEDRIRVLVRPTRDYAKLLDESTHPDAGRDALDRDRVFGLLWAGKAADGTRRALAPYEVGQLWRGDVPLFTARADSRELRTGDGLAVPALLPSSGLDRAARILRAMGPADLARQEWIIRGRLAGRAGRDVRPAAAVRQPGTDEPAQVRALALAREVGDRLAATALDDGVRLGWLGLGLVQDTRWCTGPLGTDLFDGSPGPALFLAQLAAVTGEQRYADLAERVLGPLAEHVESAVLAASRRRPAGPAPIGAFSGPAGLAYTFACCVALGVGGAALDTAAASVAPLLELLTAAVPEHDTFDVIDGCAGVLAVAESLTPRHGPVAERLAAACARRIVEGRIPLDDGAAAGWPGRGTRPLLGFSHGAAGIGWALLTHAARTGDAAARAAGVAAFAYERREYRPRTGCWPDYRGLQAGGTPDAPGSPDMNAWCHGAPGVGLARAALPASEWRPEFAEDVSRVAAAMAARGPYGNQALCHGDLGNAEVLRAIAALGTDPAHAALWSAHVDATLSAVQGAGPVCGTPDRIETPGLMAGLAGIGHGLLRVAAPEVVPPVLLLAVDPQPAHTPRTPDARAADGARRAAGSKAAASRGPRAEADAGPATAGTGSSDRPRPVEVRRIR